MSNWINFKIAYDEIDEKLVPLIGSKANPFIIYLKMRSRIVRDGWIDYKGYPIMENYYNKGKLAMSMSYRTMARDFDVSYDSVKRAVAKLVDLGWIKTERHKVRDAYLGQYIYTFGTWHTADGGRKVENYFNKPHIVGDIDWNELYDGDMEGYFK